MPARIPIDANPLKPPSSAAAKQRYAQVISGSVLSRSVSLDGNLPELFDAHQRVAGESFKPPLEAERARERTCP